MGFPQGGHPRGHKRSGLYTVVVRDFQLPCYPPSVPIIWTPHTAASIHQGKSAVLTARNAHFANLPSNAAYLLLEQLSEPRYLRAERKGYCCCDVKLSVHHGTPHGNQHACQHADARALPRSSFLHHPA